jgi:AraC-like DNA-binding protein
MLVIACSWKGLLMRMKIKYARRVYAHSPSEMAKKLPFYLHGAGWRAHEPLTHNRRGNGEYYGYQFQYVLRGRGCLTWKGNGFPLEAGDLFVIDLSQAHLYQADADDPWEVIWIHFDGSHAGTYYQMLNISNPVYRLGNSSLVGEWCRRTIQLVRHRPIGIDISAARLIMDIFTELQLFQLRETKLHPASEPMYADEVSRAVAFIEQHYAKPLKLEEIARVASLSLYHFSRIFKRATGFTVKEYLFKYRLTQAKQLLAATQLPLSEIAERIGFSDQSHFCRVFRKYESTTPKHYRNQTMDTV